MNLIAFFGSKQLRKYAIRSLNWGYGTKILMTNGSLMKVESIAECSKGSILQYFWPALSDNQCWKPNLGVFESGRFTQVLLYQSTAGIQLHTVGYLFRFNLLNLLHLHLHQLLLPLHFLFNLFLFIFRHFCCVYWPLFWSSAHWNSKSISIHLITPTLITQSSCWSQSKELCTLEGYFNPFLHE